MALVLAAHRPLRLPPCRRRAARVGRPDAALAGSARRPTAARRARPRRHATSAGGTTLAQVARRRGQRRALAPAAARAARSTPRRRARRVAAARRLAGAATLRRTDAATGASSRSDLPRSAAARRASRARSSPREESLDHLLRELLIAGPLALLLASLAGYALAAGGAAPGRGDAPPRRGGHGRRRPAAPARAAEPATRSRGSRRRSTRCSPGSRRRSSTSAVSSPTRATSCARRSRCSAPSSSSRCAGRARGGARERAALGGRGDRPPVAARRGPAAHRPRRPGTPAAAPRGRRVSDELLDRRRDRFAERRELRGRELRVVERDRPRCRRRSRVALEQALGEPRRQRARARRRARSSSRRASGTARRAARRRRRRRASRRVPRRAPSTASAAPTRRAAAAAPASGSRSSTLIAGAHGGSAGRRRPPRRRRRRLDLRATGRCSGGVVRRASRVWPPPRVQDLPREAGEAGRYGASTQASRLPAAGRRAVADRGLMQPLLVPETISPPRPLLRGTLHQVGFFVACGVGAVFVSAVDGRRLVAAAVFAAAAVTMLGASALYHRVMWSPRARAWMRRLDHAGIYLLIAGTYTPVGLLALHGTRSTWCSPWSGPGPGLRFSRRSAGSLRRNGSPPFWASHSGGWGSSRCRNSCEQRGRRRSPCSRRAVSPTRSARWSTPRRPDPLPAVFGYHEMFHALTLVALTCQYVAIAFFVVRVG